jgi:hypothetical protein
MSAKFTGHFSPVVPPFPARGLSRLCRRGGSWWRKFELKSRVSYNKPTAAVHLVALVTGVQWKKKKNSINRLLLVY